MRGCNAWHKQETYKGYATPDEAGWGFGNPNRIVWETDPSTGLLLPFSRPYYPDAAAAALAPPEQLRDIPVFIQKPPSMFTNSISVESRNSLLARAIPALSGPVGSREIMSDDVENVDMNAFERPNNWGRSHAGYGVSWMHGDLKDMAFFYNHKLFKDVAEKGLLK